MTITHEPVAPELEAPTTGTYQDLIEGHDWESHLPPCPDGRLVATADHCPGCGATVHFLLGQDGAVLAARFTPPGPDPAGLFLLENSRMEPTDPEACRRILQDLNPDSERVWSCHVDPDGETVPGKYRPLGAELPPAFGDLLRQRRWKHRQDSPGGGLHVHVCDICQARMHVSLGQGGHVARVLVRLPAARERHYLGDGNAVTPVTDNRFYGREPRRLTQEQISVHPPRRPKTNRTRRA